MSDKRSQRQTWPELAAVLAGRLLFLGLLLLQNLLFSASGELVFYAIVAIGFTVTIPYSLWLRSRVRSQEFAPLQFLVDITLVSALVYVSGGMNSAMTLLYPLVILSAGIVGTPRQAAQITALSILAFFTLMILMGTGRLVPPGTAAAEPLAIRVLAPQLLLRGALLALAGLVSAYVANRCAYVSRKEAQFRSLAQSILTHVRTGLLLLDGRYRIRFANPTAADLLDRPAADLAGRAVTEVLADGGDAADVENRRTLNLRRRDGETVPVSCRTARLDLPAEAIPGGPETGGDKEPGLLLAFHDIRDLLDLQERLKDAERLRAAAETASGLAHEIRTPLAAVSGAVQLLQRRPDMAPDVRQDLVSMIMTESTRINDIIERMLNDREYSEDTLRQLLSLHLDENAA